MANNTPSWVQVHPSFMEPELILPVAQVSGAFDLIEGGAPRARLSETDLWVYMKRIDLRTQMAMGATGFNQLPGVSISLSQIQAPTYLLRVRAEYDSQDEAYASRWGFSLPQAYRLGGRQAHFQLMRNLLLYGANPQNGEGLLNTAGATAINLPQDTLGNDTVLTYDNGEMAIFLLQQIELMKVRTNQMGTGSTFAICGPQRVLGQFMYPNIVQVTQYQRPGAGTDTTKGTFVKVAMENGDTILWTMDDTLIGKGSGGADAVVLTMPEIQIPSEEGINTNEFDKLTPGNNTCMTMYCDMAAPREIVSPLPGGATDVIMELRCTSGWGIRPEAITVMSMVYE